MSWRLNEALYASSVTSGRCDVTASGLFGRRIQPSSIVIVRSRSRRNILGIMSRSNSDLHIRQSKSDPILLLPSGVCRIETGLDNQNHHHPPPLSPSWHQQLSHSWEQEYYYHSLEDLTRATNLETNMLTIEGLRSHFNSCFSCGVSWYEDHVSLDCSECGGYAMQRPCPKCDGQCESVWRRDLAASHDSHKAQWEGECKLLVNDKQQVLNGLLQNSNFDRRERSPAKNLNDL